MDADAGSVTDNVDGDRLRRDVEATGEFGAVEAEAGRGRTALLGAAANRRAREYFVERLEDADLAVRVDRVGNIAGRWVPPGADPDRAAVAAGSHLDSVPEGGIFDGPLGVYGALEAVRALRAADVDLARPVEVVSFTEEEGQRFAPGLLGSSVAAGARGVEDALELRAPDGTTLADALADAGFAGEGRLDAAAWDAWLELHVEQARELERASVPVGVVTAVTGIAHADVTVTGEADHAGTTPMAERADALAAASEFVLDVEAAAREVCETTSDTAVGTVGRLDVAPNATNVVPGAVEMGLDVRAVDRGAMDALLDRARGSLARLERERGVDTAMTAGMDLDPTPMGDRCRTAATGAADAAGVDTLALHSGAAHDTMHVAGVTEAGMLFAPSRDGASHSPREWTDWGDCAAATRVLADALRRLAAD